MLRLLPLLLTTSILTGHAQQLKSWPTVLNGRGSAKVILPDNEQPPFIYLSKNFKFISSKKLDSTKIATFAATAESVPAAIDRIPLKLKKLPELLEGEQRHPIYITSTIEEFIKMGGSEQAAGYYSGRKKAVILRADQFLDIKRPDYRLLTHEMVHLSMHGINAKANAWFTEGNAEYFACALIGNGSYNFSSMSRSIKDRTKGFFKPAEPLKLHSIKGFITRDSNQWRVINSNLEAKDRYAQYMTALLLVHYFYHIDPDGRAKVAKYLELMQTGKKEITHQAHLFPEDDLLKIEQAISNYWKPRGYQIIFFDLTQ